MGVSLLAKPAKWARNTTHGTYHILPKKVAPPTICHAPPIAHRNSRKVPMQHLESFLNARNIIAKEL